MRVGADISGTKISVARWVLIYRNVLAAPQRASKVLRYIRLCQVVAHSPGILPSTPTRDVAQAVSRTPAASRTPTLGVLLVCTSYLLLHLIYIFLLAYAVNRAVPGAGNDHDRDNRATFSMHQALSSGGNGAAAAAAAAIIAHAKINRVRSGGGSSGGSSSSSSARGSSSGSSRVGGSSSGGGPSSGQQKRTLVISDVSGGGRGQAAPPGTRSGAGPGSTAKYRRSS